MKLLLLVLVMWMALSGIACVLVPERVVARRKERGTTGALWTGGWFFETPSRTRVMGALVTLVALLVALLAARVGRL